jgi:hypothetical protein
MRASSGSDPHRVKALTLVLAVLTYSAAAMALSPAVFVDMFGSYLEQAVVIPLFIGVWLPLIGVVRRPRSPLTYVVDTVREGGARFVLILALFCTGIAAFTTFKLKIPELVPFYADPFLADLDEWLHRGVPGELAHALVPAWAQYPLGYLYGPIWFMLWFGMTGFVALQHHAELRLRYFCTMAASVCLLGTVAATAFSSVGPVFYEAFFEPDRFAALMQALERSAVGDYMKLASGYLLDNYLSAGSNMGTGISAMPSMHLAVATLNAFLLARISRPVGVVAWIYVALIQLGSVYLGWHYAIDGYFSIATVAMLWWAMGAVVSKRTATDPATLVPVRA